MKKNVLTIELEAVTTKRSLQDKCCGLTNSNLWMKRVAITVQMKAISL
jgi:hypothetical protein